MTNFLEVFASTPNRIPIFGLNQSIVITYSQKEVYPMCAPLTQGSTLRHYMLPSCGESYMKLWLISLHWASWYPFPLRTGWQYFWSESGLLVKYYLFWLSSNFQIFLSGWTHYSFSVLNAIYSWLKQGVFSSKIYPKRPPSLQEDLSSSMGLPPVHQK